MVIYFLLEFDHHKEDILLKLTGGINSFQIYQKWLIEYIRNEQCHDKKYYSQ